MHGPPQANDNQLGTALLVAFHYPPCAGSSGLLRTLKFSRYLPDFGWQPVVLSAHSRVYEMLDPQGEEFVPDSVPVIRAFALDTKLHLSIRGSYLRWMALPDRWASWGLSAVLSGWRAIRKHRVRVIFSTFPIASAVWIGLRLHLLTGIPWVVDLRDSMTEEGYPRDALTRRVWRWIEQQAMRHSARVIFTAASTRKMYLERYPNLLSPEKCQVISNGYDEEDFLHLKTLAVGPVRENRPLRLLHTGLVYPEERDPRPFFHALARLKTEGRVGAESLNIAFRAPGAEDLYRRLLAENRIEDLVALEPHVPYRQALQECADADGLLLFQAANCDHQIPAKAYEYLRTGKPIFALTTHTGDTAALLREVEGATIINLTEEEEIYRGLPAFLQALRTGTHPLPDRAKISKYSRCNQAEELARLFTELAACKPEVDLWKAERYVGQRG